MKKIAVVAALVFFVHTYSVAESPKMPEHPRMPAMPILIGDAGQWDFGDVPEGQTVKHDFQIKNNSDKTLKINGVNSSCGCTVSQAKKTELPPGESTTIEVSFNSSGYNGWAQQFVFVNTDSLQSPVFRYIIRANVISGKKDQKKK